MTVAPPKAHVTGTWPHATEPDQECGNWLSVVVPTPVYSGLDLPLTYRHDSELCAGRLVRVPLGRRSTLGVVWDTPPSAPKGHVPIKAVQEPLPLPALTEEWRRLVQFTARYYQRGLGEVALSALPPALKTSDALQLTKRLQKMATAPPAPPGPRETGHDLHPEQEQALAAIARSTRPVLLYGATGSGKTEVYLRAVEQLLDSDPDAQAMVMVPEINLTPQLAARFEARFGANQVCALHSGLSPIQRLQHWLRAHLGQVRIVLGTRMAILASLPRLRMIIVDEEHDPSYKSQEGARFSARDLAVFRAHQITRLRPDQACTVVLGSATPSLESWQAAQQGRYERVTMSQRVGGGSLATLRLVDMHHQPKQSVLAPPLLEAIAQRWRRGEQSMVLLNRRGYAPVLACHDCGWLSHCPHCSAHSVYHKSDRTLRCHHCGHSVRVYKACPDCGNLDLHPVGRGTEQLEEQLTQLLAGLQGPDGQQPRILRIDADSTRQKGRLEAQLEAMHQGQADVLVGTQMIAKGHDFRHVTLVASLETDSGLFASDYRAPERLFALLMQAAGRAGRDARFIERQNSAVELWVQTWHPGHPLFAALARHDYPGFAASQLEERQAAQMPPFSYQAIIRVEANNQAVAQDWLTQASTTSEGLPGRDQSTLYPPIPAAMPRIANIERAQMLVESPSRPALQAFLLAWQPHLLALRQQPSLKGVIRWSIDMDPLSV